ncbi:Checkpoint serine/threonine-protein kinase BUB1-like [Heracleum sosnowskyi]|uniref:Checkpoint serine/threonine-protein kinase BUB1-like n=1 Tax=Heracleum sosnowskyi TaxID=360622 RepID=A0AAD8GU21_9APIA|nr:Checkpoint serine/threonine-protein kinase BUB1-like [Heracleum sosnowskyi]
MVVYGGVSTSVTRCATICCNHKLMFGVKSQSVNSSIRNFVVRLALKTSSYALVATTAVAAAVSVFICVVDANAVEIQAQEDVETFLNVPDTLSSECESDKDCKKPRIQRPKSKKAEFCTVRCVNTCLHGGDASGSLSLRGPMVVFRKGFRSRQYCLVECSDICNLIGDGEDGF